MSYSRWSGRGDSERFILDPRIRLLHSIAGQYLEKEVLWNNLRQIIEIDPTISFSDLCQRYPVEAATWYHALNAIPAGEVPQGTLEYIGILISSIDEILHIESSDDDGEKSD